MPGPGIMKNDDNEICFIGKGYNYGYVDGVAFNLCQNKAKEIPEEGTIIISKKLDIELMTKVKEGKIKAAIIECGSSSHLKIFLDANQIPMVINAKNPFGKKPISEINTGDRIQVNSFLGTVIKLKEEKNEKNIINN